MLFYAHLGNILAVTPKSLREEILELSHSQFYSSHFGASKILQRLLECMVAGYVCRCAG